MKIDDKKINAVRYKMADYITGQEFGGTIDFGGTISNELSNVIIFEDIYELEDTVKILKDMYKKAMEARHANSDRIRLDGEDGWFNFHIKEPTEQGLYVVKLRPNSFSTFENGIAKNIVEWNGKDFLLPIGRPITDEVLYWKKI